jgi:O-acetyl-ADP-ribose deacetylase
MEIDGPDRDRAVEPSRSEWSVATITAVRSDITAIAVDAIVNAANSAMRGGGGGVNDAIHRVGGPAILADCAERFPDGLATGDAGWTTAGDLAARWVIHTVGPKYSSERPDRALLKSCYTRALQVADELGVRSIAFPLVSSGAHGWPRHEAITVAVETIAESISRVDEVLVVASDEMTYDEIDQVLARSTPLRILQGVRVLHQRGYQGIRILPGISPSGMHWRVAITTADNLSDAGGYLDLRHWDRAVTYTTGTGAEFAGTRVRVTSSPNEVADIVHAAMPYPQTADPDPEYARWYDELICLVEQHDALPVAYADYFDAGDGWEIGWGSGIRHKHP